MDSSDGHSDVSDGSGSGPETKVTIKTDKSRDKGPKWACSKATFQEWLWETEPAWDAMGLQKTYTGRNRADSESFDKAVRERYAKSNRKLFRAIIRQLERETIQGKAMRMMIKDEFGADRDGYALLEYITLWANDLTRAELKKIRRDMTNIALKDTDTPDMWQFKGQTLLSLWKQLPPTKRGGGIAELSDALLDKVPNACQTYVEYVRAFTSVNQKSMDDYQAILKLLVDRHREHGGKITQTTQARGGSERRTNVGGRLAAMRILRRIDRSAKRFVCAG